MSDLKLFVRDYDIRRAPTLLHPTIFVRDYNITPPDYFHAKLHNNFRPRIWDLQCLDWSQSSILPWDRRCRPLSSAGRHLGLLIRAKLGRVQNEGQQKFQRGRLRDLEQSDTYHCLTTFWERFLLQNRILKLFFHLYISLKIVPEYG